MCGQIQWYRAIRQETSRMPRRWISFPKPALQLQTLILTALLLLQLTSHRLGKQKVLKIECNSTLLDTVLRHLCQIYHFSLPLPPFPHPHCPSSPSSLLCPLHEHKMAGIMLWVSVRATLIVSHLQSHGCVQTQNRQLADLKKIITELLDWNHWPYLYLPLLVTGWLVRCLSCRLQTSGSSSFIHPCQHTPALWS